MYRPLLSCLLCLLTLLPSLALAGDDRPRVGLVLAGGGARGAAHVGVLKVLEANKVPVDYVAGTSMGAFVGGLYASGKSADEIEQLMLQLDWDRGYRERPERADQSLRRKEQRDRFQLGVELGVSDQGELKLPKGVLQGQAMAALIHRALGDMPNLKSFDELPIPFRALATNIETHEEVVLGRGSLAKALQASMAVPGIVRPVELEGLLLVDGGVVNNMPISVVKAMGADIVIAVDVSSPFLTRKELGSALTIVDQLSRFLVLDNMRRQKQLLGGEDLLLTPVLDGIDTLGFKRIGQAIAAGQLAAQQHASHLQALSLDGRAYGHWQQRRQGDERRPLIDAVIIDADGPLDHAWIRDQLGVAAGDRFDQNRIDAGVARLYASELFERIDYELVEQEGRRLLRVRVREKSWGPGFVNFRLAVEDNFRDTSNYQLGASYTRSDLSSYGAEWHSEAEMGLVKRLMTELYWPFQASQDWFGLGQYEFRKAPRRLLTGPELGFIELDVTTSSYKAALGMNLGHRARLQGGWRIVDGSIEDLDGLLLDDNLHYQQSGPFLQFDWDTLDSLDFPRAGQRWQLELRQTEDRFDGVEDSSSFMLVDWLGATAAGPHAWSLHLKAGSFFNDDRASIEAFDLGGFRNLSGYSRLAISGSHMRFGALAYSYQLLENDFGFFRSPVFVGFSLEAGNVWERRADIDYEDLITAGSIYAGVDSPIGPIFLGYGRNSAEEDSLYFFLGADF
ncbi:patatin-like phospholipase family protein [Gallaecimonas sp. GXIMD4217]|uniref:patatin-like phospholipase family protein n=1 Tax=Gallaecimonas sp. GXIMD4217 TaxID=3131927 RepID=UPI00311B02B1